MFHFLDSLLVTLIVGGSAAYLTWFFWNMLGISKPTSCSKKKTGCCGK